MRSIQLHSPRLERFYREREDVPDAALGLDDARCARIGLQLAPQPQHLNIDAPVKDVFMDAGRLKQILAAQRALRRFEKGQQQRVFALAQWDLRIAGVHQPAAAALEFPAVEAVAAALGITRTCCPPHLLPPQHGADARQQLPQAEWLDDVVVGAELETDDAVDFIGPVPGRDDDGYIGLCTDLPEHIEAVVLAESQIENDQAGLRSFQMAMQFGPVGRGPAWYVVFFQIFDHHLP